MSAEDLAQEHEARQWEINNLNRKKQPPIAKPGEDGYGPAECEECEDEMPAVRRSYGFTLCTACASAREALKRR